MTTYGFHASHEQLSPESLVDAVRMAEEAGFAEGMCSDHFAPWSPRQGHSAYAWVWLGAVMAQTSLPMGVVSAPGYRYHPAVLAQAAATLERMFPGRFWMALGSGQALNEHITGVAWPDKPERNRRLAENTTVIRELLSGNTVSRNDPVRVDRARLWTLPQRPPPLLAAAVSPETASEVATWADGLITINQPDEKQRETLAAYRDAGGRGPAVLQIHIAWAEDRDHAAAIAHDQWREPVLGAGTDWELSLPEHYEQAARFIRPDTVASHVVVSHDPAEYVDRLGRQADHGFDKVMVHHVGREQRSFIESFGEHVLPELRS